MKLTTMFNENNIEIAENIRKDINCYKIDSYTRKDKYTYEIIKDKKTYLVKVDSYSPECNYIIGYSVLLKDEENYIRLFANNYPYSLALIGSSLTWEKIKESKKNKAM